MAVVVVYFTVWLFCSTADAKRQHADRDDVGNDDCKIIFQQTPKRLLLLLLLKLTELPRGFYLAVCQSVSQSVLTVCVLSVSVCVCFNVAVCWRSVVVLSLSLSLSFSLCRLSSHEQAIDHHCPSYQRTNWRWEKKGERERGRERKTDRDKDSEMDNSTDNDEDDETCWW